MADLISLDTLIKRYEGKNVDWDGTSPNQCVDWVKCYMELCLGIPTGKGKAAWGNAKNYYEDYNSIPALKSNFTRIPNTADFVPQKGDIGIFGATSTNPYGHIVVCVNGSTTKVLYSYDQNYGSNKTIHKVKHNYTNFLGVLRPKKVVSTTTTVKATTPKTYVVTANALNVRASASTSASIVKVIKKGTKVTVSTTSNGFAKIGTNQWVATAYIREE